MFVQEVRTTASSPNSKVVGHLARTPTTARVGGGLQSFQASLYDIYFTHLKSSHLSSFETKDLGPNFKCGRITI